VRGGIVKRQSQDDIGLQHGVIPFLTPTVGDNKKFMFHICTTIIVWTKALHFALFLSSLLGNMLIIFLVSPCLASSLHKVEGNTSVSVVPDCRAHLPNMYRRVVQD